MWRCSFTSVRHLICDGTFLEQRIGIYAIMNAQTNRPIFAAYDLSEGGGRLLSVYQALASSGLVPESATVDGNPQQIKYLRQVWPSLILQRCIVHVQRQGLSWCRQNPKRTDAKHLRKIFRRLSTVKTSSQANRFIQAVHAWEQRFGAAIDHSTDRGWVFSDLVRARSMLLKALPDLFHFVSNHHIPSSTNALEGYFSHLKKHYRYHCGLAVHHRDAYFKWFFYLTANKNSNTK
jgi:transposase-like protein